MGTLDGTGLVKQVTGGRSGRARRGRLAAALLGITLLCCLLGLPAAAGATAPCAAASGAAASGAGAPDFTVQALLARMALQQAELTAADGADGDQFGYAVAVGGDTAVIGAPFHDTAGMADEGAAYVYTRSGGVWNLQAELTAADGAPGDQFGYAVAYSQDTVLVGAPGHDAAGRSNAGAVYAFVRTGGSWAQQAKLTDTVSADAEFDELGYSVALDGETALIGAPFRHGALGHGAAWVFTRVGGSWSAWTAQPVLTAADGASGDRFGYTVALSGDTALIGAPRHSVFGTYQAGAAYAFVRTGGSWAQQAKLTAADGAYEDQFGSSVALSGDAALIGSPYRDSLGEADAGAAYAFARSGGTWTEQQALIAGDRENPDDRLGSAVALSGDTALVGAPGWDSELAAGAGAAYFFARCGSSWMAEDQQIAADAAGDDRFGAAVALSGSRALVGAPGHDTGRPTGAAYVSITVPIITGFQPASGPVGTAVTVNGAFFGGATAVTFGGVAADFSLDSPLQITATVPGGALSGSIGVATDSGSCISAASFTVIHVPGITQLKPASGKRGATVTISGTGFGAARGAGFVKFGAKECATYLSWSDTRIKCRVPVKAKFGKVKVTVTTAGGASNAVSFTVKR